VTDRVFDFTRAIVRTPGASVVSGLRAGGGADPSLDGVLAEHRAYVEALRGAALEVTELPPLEEYPDAIFVEDPALVFREGAILLRPGAPSRIGETALLRDALADRFPQVLEQDQGFADGGDVLTMPDRVFIGLSARTDRQGADQLARLLGELGRTAEIAETPASVLHLKTASSIVDEETVLATADLAASGIYRDYRVLIVPPGEERGANVLRVNDTILAGRRFPRIAELLDGHGARVQLLDNDQIERIDAGFTCMSLRW
jgi:dimethylargininase